MSRGTTPARASSPSLEQQLEKLDIPQDLEEKGDKEHGTVTKISIRSFDESLDTAFQLGTLRGPLCNEPVQGMAYFVEKIEIDETAENAEHCELQGDFCTLVNENKADDRSGTCRYNSTHALLTSHWQLDRFSAGRLTARTARLVTSLAIGNVFVRHSSFDRSTWQSIRSCSPSKGSNSIGRDERRNIIFHHKRIATSSREL